MSKNDIAPKGYSQRGDGARAGKLRQHFLERVLKQPSAVESLGVDPSLAVNQVLGTSEYSLPFNLVSTQSLDLQYDSVKYHLDRT